MGTGDRGKTANCTAIPPGDENMGTGDRSRAGGLADLTAFSGPGEFCEGGDRGKATEIAHLLLLAECGGTVERGGNTGRAALPPFRSLTG